MSYYSDSLSLTPFNPNGLPYQAVSRDFSGKASKVSHEWKSYYPLFKCYADHLSRFSFSKHKDDKFRIQEYVDDANNKLEEGGCCGRGFFVSHKILHEKATHISLDSEEVRPLISMCQFLHSNIAVDRYSHHPSIKSKILQGRDLFSEMILGLVPLENSTKTVESENISLLEKRVEEHLQNQVCLVAISINFTKDKHHAIFFLSNDDHHFLIDMNLPLVQFKTKEDLLKWGPQIIRTYYCDSKEIPPKHLSLEISKPDKDVLVQMHGSPRCFLKSQPQSPSPTIMRELVEYTSAIWHLPYESTRTSNNVLRKEEKIEEAMWKIKVQRLIDLVNTALNSNDFCEPLNLSPLSQKGAKLRIIKTLTDDPISKCHRTNRKLESVLDKMTSLNTEEPTNNQSLIQRVLTYVTDLKTKEAMNKRDLFQRVLTILTDEFSSYKIMTDFYNELPLFNYDSLSRKSEPCVYMKYY